MKVRPLTVVLAAIFLSSLTSLSAACLAQSSAFSSESLFDSDRRKVYGNTALDCFHDQSKLFCSQMEPVSGQKLLIRFRTEKSRVSKVVINCREERSDLIESLPMQTLPSSNGRYDYWQGAIEVGQLPKRYQFVISPKIIQTADENTDSKLLWYNGAGLAYSKPSTGDFIIAPDFHTPEWLKNGVIYQIFPDRFFDGESANNIKTGSYKYGLQKTVARNWGESPLAQKDQSPAFIFFGGDLQGIRKKLPYVLEKLGADIIYLNPVFEAPSNHKYDTSDYEKVAECLGGNEALITLSADLHKGYRGKSAHLLLDAVFNHTGDGHKWFAKYAYLRTKYDAAGAYQSRKSPYFDFYSFSSWPDKYATFLDVDSLPKLNYACNKLKDLIYAKPDSIALAYLKNPYRIDGWRVDAPQYVDRDGKQGMNAFNHGVWREFRRAVKAVNSEAVIFGEFWHDASSWLKGKEWDTVSNFDGFTQPLSQWLTGLNYDGKPASLSVSEFDRFLAHTRSKYPPNVQRSLSNHLSNHDIIRFAQRAAADERIIALALTFQMTYLGVPTIYYGDEYGMLGGRDPDDRRTFDWAQVEGERPSPLIGLCSSLIDLRKRFDALRSGSFISLALFDNQNCYAFGRMDEKHRIAVVFNAGSQEQELKIPVYKMEVPEQANFSEPLSGERLAAENGFLLCKIQPKSARILVNECK